MQIIILDLTLTILVLYNNVAFNNDKNDTNHNNNNNINNNKIM